MPRDGSATRARILNAALEALREAGLGGFSIEGVARRAQVPKGLVLYHYRSRARLLETCGAAVTEERATRLSQALAGRAGVERVDALWDELVRQQEDGTARAWLALAAGGSTTALPAEQDVVAQAGRALLDGCAAALASGADRSGLREAYDALSLALLRLEDGA